MSLNQFEWLKDYDDLFEEKKPSQLLQNSLLKKDIWDVRDDLHLEMLQHRRMLTIDFNDFSQEWFKLLVKLYVIKKAKDGYKIGTIKSYINSLKWFSIFMKTKHIDKPGRINNQTFEDFTYYLKTKNNNISEKSIHGYYKAITSFFDLCRCEKWIDISTYWFKGRTKSFLPKNEDINYIPEEVWNQLEDNLFHLPEPIQRMVIIIRTTGIRVGELLNLPFDCLRKRKQQWRLRFTTEKFNTEDELPIPEELAAVIKEQQKYIKEIFQNSYDKLFCGSNAKVNDSSNMAFKPQPKVMSGTTFNKWLNRLAKKCNICSKNGELWHFTSHQFRRTVATVMANSGIRDLIIQKYLRHRSPDMQRHYKHLLKQVLAEEYQELMREKKYVDITGRVVALHYPKNLVTELLRRKLYQITTQYGECHRPILKSACQTVNACWRCEHWLTSRNDLKYLKEDLKRVEQELKIATAQDMVRQQQGLEDDRESLSKRIKGIEEVVIND